MDPKLARGMARGGIRAISEQQNEQVYSEIWDIVSKTYSRKAATDELTKVKTLICRLLRDHPSTIIFDEQSYRTVNRSYVFWLSAASYVEEEQKEDDVFEEQTLRFGANVLVIGRKEFGWNLRQVPVSISMHAIQRFIERTDRTFQEFFSGLAHAVLCSSILSFAFYSKRKIVGLPIIFPYFDGLLLGYTQKHEFNGKFDIDRYTVFRNGKLESNDAFSPFHDMFQKNYPNYILGCNYRTFVSHKEIRENQIFMFDRMQEVFSDMDVVSKVGWSFLFDSDRGLTIELTEYDRLKIEHFVQQYKLLINDRDYFEKIINFTR
ncbi:MAG: hypothetical protein QNJ92_04815 [Alphaproteobacteria bacterium]|nr:hypothetical protein [Alphaproteobacteria bacterium]